MINGLPYLRIVNGIWAGRWVPEHYLAISAGTRTAYDIEAGGDDYGLHVHARREALARPRSRASTRDPVAGTGGRQRRVRRPLAEGVRAGPAAGGALRLSPTASVPIWHPVCMSGHMEFAIAVILIGVGMILERTRPAVVRFDGATTTEIADRGVIGR